MARDITTGFESLLDERDRKMFFLIKAEFPSGNVNLFSGLGQLIFDGETYFGGGDLLSVGDVEETNGLEANGVSYSLSGIPTSLLSIALGEDNYVGSKVTQWLGLFDPSDNTFHTTQIFSGLMDGMTVDNLGADTCTITLICENELIRLKDSVNRNWTYEDQKGDYAEDEGFDSVSTITDTQITWGQ